MFLVSCVVGNHCFITCLLKSFNTFVSGTNFVRFSLLTSHSRVSFILVPVQTGTTWGSCVNDELAYTWPFCLNVWNHQLISSSMHPSFQGLRTTVGWVCSVCHRQGELLLLRELLTLLWPSIPIMRVSITEIFSQCNSWTKLDTSIYTWIQLAVKIQFFFFFACGLFYSGCIYIIYYTFLFRVYCVCMYRLLIV